MTTRNRILVHADGGACHGMRIVNGRCSGCGIAPDTQSMEIWPADRVRYRSATEPNRKGRRPMATRRCISMNRQLFDAAAAKAQQLGQSLAGYVGTLVARDVGAVAPSPVPRVDREKREQYRELSQWRKARKLDPLSADVVAPKGAVCTWCGAGWGRGRERVETEAGSMHAGCDRERQRVEERAKARAL